MKYVTLLLALTIVSAVAQPVTKIQSSKAATTKRFSYNQDSISKRQSLIPAEQATEIVKRFRATFSNLEGKRILIYVNRDLVDQESGFKLTGQSENTTETVTEIESNFKADPNAKATGGDGITISAEGDVTVRGNVSGNNRPGSGTSASNSTTTKRQRQFSKQSRTKSSLADRQTIRDVERLFGRPLRMGGATLADQRIAAQLIDGKGIDSIRTEGEQARKDREAISKIADIALEILISSREVEALTIGGGQVQTVPDIQATAVRLKDAAIIGQAASSDILGNTRLGNRAATADVREISEATALALMEDILISLE